MIEGKNTLAIVERLTVVHQFQAIYAALFFALRVIKISHTWRPCKLSLYIVAVMLRMVDAYMCSLTCQGMHICVAPVLVLVS